MLNHLLRRKDARTVSHMCGVVSLFVFLAFSTAGWCQSFTVPDDLALRIRLDDTLTSTDSEVGDPIQRNRRQPRRVSQCPGLRSYQQHRHVGQTGGPHDNDAALRSVGYARRTPRTHPG